MERFSICTPMVVSSNVTALKSSLTEFQHHLTHLGMVTTCVWWAGSFHGIPGAGVVVLGLVPTHWCVRLGPGPLCTRLCPEMGLDSGDLKAACLLWVGLCPCLASCLAQGIPVFMLTATNEAGLGLGPKTNKIEKVLVTVVSDSLPSHGL